MSDEMDGRHPESTIGNTTGWQPFDCERWRADIVREVTGLTSAPYAPSAESPGIVPPTFLSAQYVDAFALGIPDAPARLNGGNTCRWLAPVRVGQRLERRSTVTAATRKHGRSGRLDIYTVETVYRVPAGDEVARLEYTPIRRYPDSTRLGSESPQIPRFDPPEGATRCFAVTPSARDLVRYAVATDDLYEAHYDDRFARASGLPGVIVHGLLKMAWLARAAVESTGGGFLRELSASYRGMDLVDEPVSVWCSERDADGDTRTLDLFAISASGVLSTEGAAIVEPRPPSSSIY